MPTASPHRLPQPRHRTRGNTLIGIFIGLLLGLGIASVIALYMMKSPFPFTQKERERSQRQDRAAPPVAKADPRPADKKESGTDKTGSAPAKPAEAAEVAVAPPTKPAAAEKSPPPEPGPGESVKSDTPTAPSNETFTLQAGSFPNPVDADNQKARLALIGLEANIEPVDLPDRGTWYRVRLGPYRSLGEVNQVRSQLAANGVDVQLIRARNGRN